MTTVMHYGTPDAPAVPPVPAPRIEVDRADALNCEAGALHDVGGRLVCEDHYFEVIRAYYSSGVDLILHHYDEPRGKCGQMVLGRWA